MKGEPIEAVKVGLNALVSSLRQDPFALESVYLSVLTFDREIKVLTPLTPVDEFQVPAIVAPDSGPTHLGQALEELLKRVDQEILKSTPEQKGDWKPLLFIMTDGSPSDLHLYRQMIPEVKRRNFGIIVGCAAGASARTEVLKELCSQVVVLETTDAASFGNYFKWVSASVSAGTMSVGLQSEITLPPPPPELQILV